MPGPVAPTRWRKYPSSGPPTESVALVMTTLRSGRKSIVLSTPERSTGAALRLRLLSVLAGALDPVHVIGGHLVDEHRDALARREQTAAQVAEFRARDVVLDLQRRLADQPVQVFQRRADAVGHQARLAHAETRGPRA